jgi:hypothetical protein
MDIINEQNEAYYKSIHEDLEKEIKKAEEKIKKEWENAPEPPKPTKEQLRAIRLSKLEKSTSS